MLRSEISCLLALGERSVSIQSFIKKTRGKRRSKTVVEFKMKRWSGSSETPSDSINQSPSYVSTGNKVAQETSVDEGSLYQLALATGLEEMLEVFRHSVLKAEKEILMDPLPRVSIISRHVEVVCKSFFLHLNLNTRNLG